MFPEYTLGFSLVATFFVILWLVMYPLFMWESLTFRNSDGIKGHLISIVTILFSCGFVNLFIFLADKLKG